MKLIQVEAIRACLQKVPVLVGQYEQKSARFATDVGAWLKETESVLSSHRLPMASKLAALRARMISSERGLIPPELRVSGRNSRRKAQDFVAADTLQKTEALLSELIHNSDQQLAEGERLIRQVVAAALGKGLLPARGPASAHQDWLKAAWQALAGDSELGSVTTHVAGLVGFPDVLILLDRAIPPA
jgi:hypothetical protein